MAVYGQAISLLIKIGLIGAARAADRFDARARASPVAGAKGNLAPNTGRGADDGLAQRILEHYIAASPVGGSAASGDDLSADGGPATLGQRAAPLPSTPVGKHLLLASPSVNVTALRLPLQLSRSIWPEYALFQPNSVAHNSYPEAFGF